jgi:predicted NUDIX family NTP pyrophosphohydrolase
VEEGTKPPRVKPKVNKSGRTSAGIMLWRRRGDGVEVLLGHNGGPYFARKDEGHWTVLKGEVEPGEDLLAVARREFTEETGHELPDGPGRIRAFPEIDRVAWFGLPEARRMIKRAQASFLDRLEASLRTR